MYYSLYPIWHLRHYKFVSSIKRDFSARGLPETVNFQTGSIRLIKLWQLLMDDNEIIDSLFMKEKVLLKEWKSCLADLTKVFFEHACLFACFGNKSSWSFFNFQSSSSSSLQSRRNFNRRQVLSKSWLLSFIFIAAEGCYKKLSIPRRRATAKRIERWEGGAVEITESSHLSPLPL